MGSGIVFKQKWLSVPKAQIGQMAKQSRNHLAKKVINELHMVTDTIAYLSKKFINKLHMVTDTIAYLAKEVVS